MLVIQHAMTDAPDLLTEAPGKIAIIVFHI